MPHWRGSWNIGVGMGACPMAERSGVSDEYLGSFSEISTPEGVIQTEKGGVFVAQGTADPGPALE